MLQKRIGQSLAVLLMLVLVATSIPAGIVAAQSQPVTAAQVRGELNGQFAKHYLDLRVNDMSRQVRIIMDYNPQDQQVLDTNAGFYVFDENGFRRFTSGANPALVNLATGSLNRSTGVKQKVAVIANPVGTFSVVPFNDSNVAMDYTLTVENGVLVDASGEQVVDPSAPAQAGGTAGESAPAAATPLPAPTVAAAAEETDDEGEESAQPATVAALPGTEAASERVVIQPTVIQTTTLEGVLADAYQVHIYPLEVNDIRPVERGGPGLQLRLIDVNNAGIQLIVLTEDQFRSWINSGRAPDSPALQIDRIVAGPADRGPQNYKEANIRQPVRQFMVIVYNGQNPGSPYELYVLNENGMLTDDSAQSTTAQQLSPSVPAAAATTGTTTGTAATTTGATTTAATTGDGTITPPTTYTVRSGDTLGTIARRAYGNVQLFRQLCTLNNITDCNRIEVGQQIRIPVLAELQAVTVAPAAPAAAAPAAAATPVAATAPAAAATPAAAAPAAAATPATPAPAAAAPATTTGTAASGNIVQAAGNYSVLDTLGLLLDLLELEQNQNNNIKALLTSGNYTFFAPTDTAFTSLNEAQLEQLIANPGQLAGVLRSHIVPGRLTAADLAGATSVETLAGTRLNVRAAGGAVTVGGARVVQADIAATNGVIHIIDSVLIQ
jgi:uncharacterized surface protein with fasciclin (FAS1) repeats